MWLESRVLPLLAVADFGGVHIIEFLENCSTVMASARNDVIFIVFTEFMSSFHLENGIIVGGYIV